MRLANTGAVGLHARLLPVDVIRKDGLLLLFPNALMRAAALPVNKANPYNYLACQAPDLFPL